MLPKSQVYRKGDRPGTIDTNNEMYLMPGYKILSFYSYALPPSGRASKKCNKTIGCGQKRCLAVKRKFKRKK